MRVLFYILITCFIGLSAQTSDDYSFKKNSTSLPLVFVKHSNFSTIITNSNLYNKEYTDAGTINLIGLYSDNSPKFNTTINLATPITLKKHDKILSCNPTFDKGIFFILKGLGCSSSNQTNLDINWLVKSDSMGQVIFQMFDLPNYLVSCGIVTPNYYYKAGYTQLIKINPLTGVATGTIYTATGTITATSVNEKKQIAFSTSTNLSVIDTLGNVIASTSGLFNYSQIKPHKKNYYLLNANKKTIELRDSALNSIAVYTANASSLINDFSIYNDSVYIGSHDTVNDMSTISAYSEPFNFIQAKLIPNAKHKVIGLVKDKFINLLAIEKTMTPSNNAINGNGSAQIINTSFSKFNKLNDINYTSDIVLKRIKKLAFNISVYNNPIGPIYTYSYVNSIVVANNSMDTVHFFNISHPMRDHVLGSSQYCNSGSSFKSYDSTITTIIYPMDSVEVQLPSMLGEILTNSTPVPIQFCYAVTLPNNRTDNNINNSVLCVNFTTVVANTPTNPTTPITSNLILPLIYPTITKDELNIHSDSAFASYTIRDLTGKPKMTGGNTKKIYVSALSPAMYFIIIDYSKESGLKRKVIKFIKE